MLSGRRAGSRGPGKCVSVLDGTGCAGGFYVGVEGEGLAGPVFGLLTRGLWVGTWSLRGLGGICRLAWAYRSVVQAPLLLAFKGGET